MEGTLARVRSAVLPVALAAGVAVPAWAGRNADGAMIVHTDDAVTWSLAAVCVDPRGSPGSCEDAGTTSTRDSNATVWVLASFCPTAAPAVTSVYFGIDYEGDGLEPIDHKLCGPGGSFELPDEDWPYTGRGNTIAFMVPLYDRLFPFYAFRIEGGGPGAWFCTRANPSGGYAAFVDDSDPPFLDYCYQFGCVRWFASGSNECGACSRAHGACCSEDGDCSIREPIPCADGGGAYQGDATSCDPDPCAPRGVCCLGERCEEIPAARCRSEGGVFVEEPGGCAVDPCSARGACCLRNGTCAILTEAACGAARGMLWAVREDCIEDCPQPVIERGSWGRVRSIYR